MRRPLQVTCFSGVDDDGDASRTAAAQCRLCPSLIYSLSPGLVAARLHTGSRLP